ncbi:MAG: TolC family protein [Bdellovibrionaceae bacterium]|nr:TolC family protein [Pseudobdellovibrionaceae bacterium]
MKSKLKAVLQPELWLIPLAALVCVDAQAQGAKVTPVKPTAIRKDAGPTIDLSAFLEQVGQRNGNFRALQSSREAAVARRLQGDLELSPVFTANAQAVDDKRPQIFGPAFSLTGTKNQEVSLGLSKKFSTGTQASLTGSVSETTTTLAMAGAPESSTTNAIGGLGLSVSQSLWKDFFGTSTDLRRERESLIEKAETQGLDLQTRQVLIEAEGAFWDHLYLKEEIRQREDSLARAKRIETWVRNRASNGIGDRADVLNAQGLVAGRELQLLNSEDELRASEEKIRDLLEMGAAEPLPNLAGNLEGARSPQAFIDGAIRARGETADSAAQVVRLDAYLSVLEARTKAVVAREVAEGVKPDLVLQGMYKTNSVEDGMSAAFSGVTDPAKPTTMVGVKFTYLLDGGVKDAARNSAKMESLAAEQRQSRKLMESQTSWEELQRRHAELTKKIDAAAKSSTIQTQKADAERDRLAKGRTITSTVILAEQDAAESQLSLAKMRAEQRKLESQGRLFIQISEQLSEAK